MEMNRFTPGAGQTGTRFLSAAAFILALLTAVLPCSTIRAATLRGSAGSISLQAEGTFSVRGETGQNSLIWHLAIQEEVTLQYSGTEVRKEKGGVVVELPLASSPSLTWTTKGLEFRWSAARPGTEGDPFGDSEPPAYPLGPGDKIQVTVYNVEDMDKTVIVDPKGNITLPVLDKVKAEGRPVTEFQRDLEQRLKEFIREPQVSIQVLEYGSRYVNVLGEVGNPGRIAIKGALRILDAVSQAGGFTEKSGDIEVQRRMAGGDIQTRIVHRENLLTGNKDTYNFFVHDQDVLNVQPIKSIYVSGEVKTPGSFPYSKDMTLLRAVAKAGGFGQWARKGKVDILRERPDGSTETLHADADDIEKGKTPDLPLQPNDHVVVRERKLF